MKNAIRLRWLVLLVLLTYQFQLLAARGDCKTKTTRNTCCHFPFIYRGINYTDCTKDGHNKKWCATTVNYDTDRRWGECRDCKRKTTDGKCCIFPFTYKGKSYSDCTKVDRKVNWCSTVFNYDRDKKWGTCAECKRKTTTGSCCVFPFIYKGVSYSHCTRTSHNRQWCATTSNYDDDKHWGNCHGYDSCATALHENCNKKDQYAINIAGTIRWINVTCKMDGNAAVSIIPHDNNIRTFVKGFEDVGSYQKTFKYNGNISDIISFINEAKSCRQFIKLECRHAMLNKYAWLEDRNGVKLPYWGGVPANFTGRGCACGLTDSCRLNYTKCNCDANNNAVLIDEGFIKNKSVLPITAVRLGDTGHTNEWIHYTMGNVECIFPTAAKPALGPPRVSFNPSSVVDEHRYLKITCISDICAYSYLWTKDGKLLLPTTETIPLPYISRKFAGRYSCVINTPLGRSHSSIASRLVVKYLDSPKVTVTPSELVKEGSNNVTLSCDSQGRPTLSYIWKKNGYLTIGKAPQLIISNITRDDTGDYVCIVSNKIKEKYSRTVKLFIQYIDTPIVLPSTPQLAYIGDSIMMLCYVTSHPKSSVRWFHNHTRLISKDHVLRIAKLSPDDNGLYSCSAENIIGKRISSPTLIRLIGSNGLRKNDMHKNNVDKPIASKLQIKKTNKRVGGNPYFAGFIVFLVISVALAAYILWNKCKRKRPIELNATSSTMSSNNAIFKYSELNNTSTAELNNTHG